MNIRSYWKNNLIQHRQLRAIVLATVFFLVVILSIFLLLPSTSDKTPLSLASHVLDVRESALRYNSEVGSWPDSIRTLEVTGYLPQSWASRDIDPRLGVFLDDIGQFFVTLAVTEDHWNQLSDYLSQSRYDSGSKTGRVRVSQVKSKLYKIPNQPEPQDLAGGSVESSQADISQIRSNIDQILRPESSDDPFMKRHTRQ